MRKHKIRLSFRVKGRETPISVFIEKWKIDELERKTEIKSAGQMIRYLINTRFSEAYMGSSPFDYVKKRLEVKGDTEVVWYLVDLELRQSAEMPNRAKSVQTVMEMMDHMEIEL